MYLVRELSDKLNLTLQTIRNYIKQGKLNGRKIGGRWYVSPNTNKTTTSLNYPIRKFTKRSAKTRKAQKLSYKLRRLPNPANATKAAGATAIKMELIQRAIKQNRTFSIDPLNDDIVEILRKQMTGGQHTHPPGEAPIEPYEETPTKNHNKDKDLDKREAMVLCMRYGIDDGEPMTLKQIGEKLNLSRERVRQIECEALKKLSHIHTQSRQTNNSDTYVQEKST